MKKRQLAYAGIGSRETPDDIQAAMTAIARRLHDLGFVLYSGGADGADTAFYNGSGDLNEIYLPWDGFNQFAGKYRLPAPAAFTIASLIHPGWRNLKKGGRPLMARNCHQVMREDLATPVDFVVCWTQDGAEESKDRSPRTGGTGQAIDLASRMGIPVVNLARDGAMEKLADLVHGATKP